MRKKPKFPKMNACVLKSGEMQDPDVIMYANFVAIVDGVDTLQVVKHRWGMQGIYRRVETVEQPEPDPVPMILWCPDCRERHVDEGEFAHRPHHTHACQHCGMVWRPAVVATVGVKFLPGFKNEED